jgi:hypothetical protein|tara:strand:- start:55 stop:399 length:345 start_codon:yes stop_codon:yes gene_type:complete
MAHFAKLGVGNVVQQIFVVSNSVFTTEKEGVDWINNFYKTKDIWIQTSYNSNFRKNYASVGYTYNDVRDAFIPPKPYNSWTLNEDTCLWEAPVAYPTDGQEYNWNEDTTSWTQV